MGRGERITWTKEALTAVMDKSVPVGEIAGALNCSENTVYSMRTKIKAHGGIDEYLEYVSKVRPKGDETLEMQMERVYKINLGTAGRGYQIQFNVTIPSRIAERFVAEFGTNVRFVPFGNAIVIVPVDYKAPPVLPSWITGLDSDDGYRV